MGDLLSGKLLEQVLWQRKTGVNIYGEAEHDDGRLISCRGTGKSRIKNQLRHSKNEIGTVSYYVVEDVRCGDLLDGCTVLEVRELSGVFGGRCGLEAVTN